MRFPLSLSFFRLWLYSQDPLNWNLFPITCMIFNRSQRKSITKQIEVCVEGSGVKVHNVQLFWKFLVKGNQRCWNSPSDTAYESWITGQSWWSGISCVEALTKFLLKVSLLPSHRHLRHIHNWFSDYRLEKQLFMIHFLTSSRKILELFELWLIFPLHPSPRYQKMALSTFL